MNRPIRSHSFATHNYNLNVQFGGIDAFSLSAYN